MCKFLTINLTSDPILVQFIKEYCSLIGTTSLHNYMPFINTPYSELDLSYNVIKQIQDIAALTNLTQLYLACNSITKIEVSTCKLLQLVHNKQ